MKKSVFLLLFICFSFINSCKSYKKTESIQLKGNVFGTTYSITYTNNKTNYQQQIDRLFYAVNKSLSTYITNSVISKINNNDTTVIVDDLFLEVFEKSKKIHKETMGYFDPTVGNLVNAWGFGPEKAITNLDATVIKNLLEFVGLEKVKIINRKVVKNYSEIYLDFNSIAKGFGIDIIGRFLEQKNITNYLIEIGGEIRARGLNLEQKPWRVGIENPDTDGTRTLLKVIDLSNESMASSGNYRKFRISEDGKKYVHTINPKTGLATESNLLSATVIAALDCADVDAYATAFMAMGLEKTKIFLKENKELKVLLIYSNEQGDYKEYSTI